VFEVVGHVEPAALTAAGGNPSQARARKGTPIGGQWIEMARALLDKAKNWLDPAYEERGPDEEGGGLVETPDGMPHPPVDPNSEEFKMLRESYVSGQGIDENGEWTPERKVVHEKIVNDLLSGVEPPPEGVDPEVWFNGGGPASGKGGFTNGRIDAGYPTVREVDDITGAMDFEGMPNPGAVLIDPDSIKMQLPEVKAMRQTQRDHGDMANAKAPGGNWPGQSHEESSYIAKLAYAEAQRRGLNVVYDGTGLSIVKKAKEAKANGYGKVHANYMYAEPEVALPSAVDRAQRIGRNISVNMQAGQYQKMPKAFDDAVASGLFSTVGLWDRQQNGKQIFTINPDGSHNVIDQAAYDAFHTSNLRIPSIPDPNA
jgi:hypothetical protein